MFKYLLETFTHIIYYLFSRNSYVCPIRILVSTRTYLSVHAFLYVLVKYFSARIGKGTTFQPLSHLYHEMNSGESNWMEGRDQRCS